MKKEIKTASVNSDFGSKNGIYSNVEELTRLYELLTNVLEHEGMFDIELMQKAFFYLKLSDYDKTIDIISLYSKISTDLIDFNIVIVCFIA